MKTLPKLLPTLALLCCSASGAQTTPLNPPDARISDRAISADQRSYESLQARIKALNDGGRPLRDHHLAKAQCWLDTSFHEYTRNDRGPWPQAALTEAEKLVQAMEARQTPLPADTPLIAGAERIRADLWQRSAALRSGAGWACAQARAACGEVELVHAGHEQAQLGWRHARPYVQMAEDLIATAEAQAQSCAPPAPAPAVVAVAPAPVATPAPLPVASPPAAAEPRPLELFGQVVFRFDGETLADVPRGGLLSLQALLERVRAEKLDVRSVRLSGHADRLNNSGRADYNQLLSEQRVKAVRDLLVAQGISADRIQSQASGDRQPRESCGAPLAAGQTLRDCLLPNRRVEIVMDARRP